MRTVTILLLSAILASCALRGVRQADLDAWVGVPVSKLDTHPIFLSMRLERSFAENGNIEIRNYVNELMATAPIAGMLVTKRMACNNIFYITDGYVTEYRPTGRRCFTDERVRPLP